MELCRYDLEKNIWIAKSKFDQNFFAHTKTNSILGSNLWMIYNESKDGQKNNKLDRLITFFLSAL